MRKIKVMLDMDGVLVNFIQGAISIHGKPLKHDEVDTWNFHKKFWQMSSADFFKPMEFDFWTQLERYDWAYHVTTAINDVVTDNETFYCTSPSDNKGCIDGKKFWLRTYGFHGDNHEQFIPIRRKDLLAGPDVLLIDDSDHNVAAFRNAGGMAILFPQPWNENRELTEDRIGYLRKQLEIVTNNSSRIEGDAKARKSVPLFSGLVSYFPSALAAVAQLSQVGNDQHNPGQPLHWDRSKSGDHHDCLMRHLFDAGTVDTDGVSHSTKVAWRALAALQLELEVK